MEAHAELPSTTQDVLDTLREIAELIRRSIPHARFAATSSAERSPKPTSSRSRNWLPPAVCAWPPPEMIRTDAVPLSND
jgi:hypothetical protein